MSASGRADVQTIPAAEKTSGWAVCLFQECCYRVSYGGSAVQAVLHHGEGKSDCQFRRVSSVSDLAQLKVAY